MTGPQRVLLLGALAVLAGCSPRSNIVTSLDDTPAAAGYDALAVEVLRAPAVKRNADFDAVRENLTAALVTKIPGQTGLAVAADASAARTALLRIVVTRLVYTGQWARIAVGSAAGVAILETTVTLSDGASGKSLWEASSSARSDPGVMGSSTTTQVETLSGQLMQEVKARIGR